MNPEQRRETDPSQETSVEIDLAKVGEVALEKLRSLEAVIKQFEQEKKETEDRINASDAQEGSEEYQKDIERLENINNSLLEYKKEEEVIRGIFELVIPQSEIGA